MKTTIITIDDARKSLIMEDRAAYLSGDNKTFSIDEVKQMALVKDRVMKSKKHPERMFNWDNISDSLGKLK
jgi:hypothetical protein